MVYTITLNPSLDYFVTVEDFALGKTNRAKTEQMVPGGKGLNVSMVLKNLGVESTALGFTAGFVGKEIIRRIEELGICAELIHLDEGNSRINVKIKNIEGTEINGIGPEIPQFQLENLLKRVENLETGDYLILAGSIPGSVPDSIYQDMMERLQEKKIDIVVDASGKALLRVLPYKPFLVKPNHHELGELFGVELHSRKEVIVYAKMLQGKGARNVLVSMAGQGAVLITENQQVFEMEAPKGTLVNAVGAGDSMVAGFLTGWIEKREYSYAFQMAVCAGSASAFSENLAKRTEVEALMNMW